MADPLALLGYQPQQPLPALQARPPALNYLGPDAAQGEWLNYATRPLPQANPVVTSTGLPDIEVIQRNMAAGFTEQLKARQAQAKATQDVIGAIGTLNPQANDYLTQRNQLLQRAPWALQSKDVTGILAAQEDAHKEHLGEIKNLGEFSDKYHTEYQTLKKSGKNDPDASALAMAAALTAKARVDFMEQGAPREVVDRVFKKDGTFDREAMAEWKGEQKRLEFDKRMNGEKGGFIPISQEQGSEISAAVDRMLSEPTDTEKLNAYNAVKGTKYTATDTPDGVWKEAYGLAKKQAEGDLRKTVNKLALSGYKLPKSLQRYVDSEDVTDDLELAIKAKLAQATEPGVENVPRGTPASPYDGGAPAAETTAQKLLREARERQQK